MGVLLAGLFALVEPSGQSDLKNCTVTLEASSPQGGELIPFRLSGICEDFSGNVSETSNVLVCEPTLADIVILRRWLAGLP